MVKSGHLGENRDAAPNKHRSSQSVVVVVMCHRRESASTAASFQSFRRTATANQGTHKEPSSPSQDFFFGDKETR